MKQHEKGWRFRMYDSRISLHRSSLHMRDLLLLAGFVGIRQWSIIIQHLQFIGIRRTSDVAGYAILATVLYLATQLLRSYLFTGASDTLSSTSPAAPNSSGSPPNDHLGLGIRFIPSRTSHTRFIPKRHSFSYSYLLVGIPIGWKGSEGGMLSVDAALSTTFKGKSTWFSVDAADYLDRGYGQLGLEGKLGRYLKSQKHDPAEYPFAYLFTQPKFLGYFNNPVSFWYLYGADKKLKAMILEVNNTFEERRMYLLAPEEPDTGAEDPFNEVSVGEVTKSKEPNGNNTERKGNSATTIGATNFSHKWVKDFHVSPFSSRKGFYKLNTSDPLAPGMSALGPMSGTITLISSKEETKLVARIFSDGEAINPSTMTALAKTKFVLNWWWLCYLTFPRVAYEAAKLWFKKGLYVWGRPEPHTTTISRSATDNETALEGHFKVYLRHLVESYPKPLSLRYISAGIRDGEEETMFHSASAQTTVSKLSDVQSDGTDLREKFKHERNASGDEPKKNNDARAAREPNAETPTMEFRVLTPIFYTRFTHYAHDLEAFFSEAAESKTICITPTTLLPQLVLKKPTDTQEITSWTDALYFSAIQRLRRRPARLEAVSYIGKPDDVKKGVRGREAAGTGAEGLTARVEDIRSFRPSSMDGFMIARATRERRRSYRWEVLRSFVADRIALGDVWLLGLEWALVKIVVLWWLAGRVYIPLRE